MNEFGVSYDNLCGTNYLFNSSLQLQADFSLLSFPEGDPPASPLYGTYSAENVESELRAIAEAGFNKIRIWPPFFGWIIDPAQFAANLREFVARCRAHRLTISWVLWNAVGNGVLWQSHDLVEIVRDAAEGDVTNDELYRNLDTLTQVFQKRHGQWVPDDKPWHLTGYPAPGNKLIATHGSPSGWADEQVLAWVEGYLDTLFEIMRSPDGAATLFQIDLGNEFDGVFVPLPQIAGFLAWNQAKVRAALPAVPLTVGWAFHDLERYAGYVAALDAAGVELGRHSFHIYVQEPAEYEASARPLIEWAEARGLPLMVTEFYRVDTAEWGALQVGLEFFERAHVPTIMWGFISSNIYDDPGKPGNQGTPHLDGVLTAKNPEFRVGYEFEPLNPADLRAVLEYNERRSGEAPISPGVA